MKSVIRVQDKNGRGMFQMGNNMGLGVHNIPELYNLHIRHINFPTGFEDTPINRYLNKKYGVGIDFNKLNYRFSFINIGQFEKWVLREEVAILNKYGFRVYKVETDNYVQGDYQIIFDVNSIKSITDITDLFL